MRQDVLLVDSVEQATVLLKPLRIELLAEMAEPRTCPELAERFRETPQKIYYHVKTMERAGLVERAGERSVNGIAEGHYRAKARAFWLSPRLVRGLGGQKAVQEQTSLRILAGHAEQMLEDVGHLAERSAAGEHTPSLSLAVDITLPTRERREEFLNALTQTFEQLARQYTGTAPTKREAPETFRFTLTCYPTPAREAS